MREMKDSGIEWIGEIPKDWEIRRNKRVMSKIKDIRKRYSGEDVLSLTMNGVIVRDLDNPYGKMPTTFDGYQYIQRGNLLMCLFDIDVTPRCIGLIKDDGVTSPAYSQFKLLDDNYAPYYYYYYLYLDHKKELLHLAKNLRHSFTEEQLGELFVPMPPQKEQKQIADYLDAKCSKIDTIIEKQQVIIEKLKEYKLSLITECVTKGLNPDVKMKDSGYEYIGLVPYTWEICRLRNIGIPQNGISKGAEFFGEGYPFVSYGDVYRNYSLPQNVNGLIMSTEEEREKYSVRENDIFFTRTSETIEEVGFSSVCEETIPNATYAGFVIRVRPFNDKLTNGFAKYYFRGEHHRIFLAKEMNLVTRASLGQDLLKSLPVLVPPKAEQDQIADYLDNKCRLIDKNIIEKQNVIEKLQAYKKSLIYEVVTGKKEI